MPDTLSVPSEAMDRVQVIVIDSAAAEPRHEEKAVVAAGRTAVKTNEDAASVSVRLRRWRRRSPSTPTMR